MSPCHVVQSALTSRYTFNFVAGDHEKVSPIPLRQHMAHLSDAIYLTPHIITLLYDIIIFIFLKLLTNKLLL